MHICLVSYEFPPYGGGEAKYTFNLAQGLAEFGHRVTVICPKLISQNRGYETGKFTIVQVKASPKPLLKVGSFVRSVSKLLPSFVETEKVDLVHITFDYPLFPLRLSHVECPKVATLHHLHLVEAMSYIKNRRKNLLLQIPYLLKQYMITKLELSLLDQVDAIISVSDFTRKSVASKVRVAKERIRVISDGVLLYEKDDAFDPSRFARQFDLGSSQIVLYVGRIEQSKGLEDLIQAFRLVREKLNDASLVIIGKGPEGHVRKLKQLAKNIGIEQAILFAGRVDDSVLRDAYAGSRLLILPSLMEGFGITLVEAMLAGKPCVATNVGSIPEIVKDGINGLLVEPSNPQQMADGMLWILNHKMEAEAMGKRGQALAKELYTVEQMIRKTEGLYLELVQEGRLLEKC